MPTPKPDRAAIIAASKAHKRRMEAADALFEFALRTWLASPNYDIPNDLGSQPLTLPQYVNKINAVRLATQQSSVECLRAEIKVARSEAAHKATMLKTEVVS